MYPSFPHPATLFHKKQPVTALFITKVSNFFTLHASHQPQNNILADDHMQKTILQLLPTAGIAGIMAVACSVGRGSAAVPHATVKSQSRTPPRLNHQG
jgi:hypothetical protein